MRGRLSQRDARRTGHLPQKPRPGRWLPPPLSAGGALESPDAARIFDGLDHLADGGLCLISFSGMGPRRATSSLFGNREWHRCVRSPRWFWRTSARSWSVVMAGPCRPGSSLARSFIARTPIAGAPHLAIWEGHHQLGSMRSWQHFVPWGRGPAWAPGIALGEHRQPVVEFPAAPIGYQFAAAPRWTSADHAVNMIMTDAADPEADVMLGRFRPRQGGEASRFAPGLGVIAHRGHIRGRRGPTASNISRRRFIRELSYLTGPLF